MPPPPRRWNCPRRGWYRPRVEGRPREFVIAEPGGQPLGPVRAELAKTFTVSSDDRPARATRTWLDTFDWRLYKAGLTLQQVTGPGHSPLIPTRPGRRT